MPQQLIIELSQEATVKYLAYARGVTGNVKLTH